MDRFWSKVDKQGPFPEGRRHLGRCWIWTRAKIPEGYGSFGYEGRQRGAHVMAWFLTHGVWPERQLNHKCENRACVRPSHLEEVTVKQNLHYSKTTMASINAAKTHCPAGHEYSEENTRVVGKGLRQCKICNRTAKRESWRRLHMAPGAAVRGPRRAAER